MERAFVDWLAAQDRVLLCGHEHPDGDCLGSQAGLFHLLAALGKRVAILNPDPVPPYLGFLRSHADYGVDRASEPLPECDAVVLLDCAELSRLGQLGAKIARAGVPVAVIDHHVESERSAGAAALVDASAAATGVLVYRLFQRLGQPVGAAAAEGLFVALVADTGWFHYSNTGAEALAMAAALVEAGADPGRLYDAMHRHRHPESIDLLCRSLDTHRFELGGRLAYACLDKSAMARASRIGFPTESLLEPLRSVEGVEVAALFKELYDGSVKVSLRATGGVDVREVAAAFGGGGHVKAAGALIRQPMPEAVAALTKRVQAALSASLAPDREK